MSNLVINANDAADGVEFEIGYRVYGTGSAYLVVAPNPVALPATVPNVPRNRYEAYVKKKCANGIWSDLRTGVSLPCAPPTSFSVFQNGQSFNINYVLAFGQTKFNLEITDPNGGKQTVLRTDGNSGTITVGMNPIIPGVWSFRLQGVCDDTVNPLFASDWTNPTTVSVSNSSVCQPPTAIVVSAITNNSATVSATPPAGSTNAGGYTLQYGKLTDLTPITITSATPNFNLTGLEPNTQYGIYMMTNCSNNIFSDPVFGGTFTTLT